MKTMKVITISLVLFLGLEFFYWPESSVGVSQGRGEPEVNHILAQNSDEEIANKLTKANNDFGFNLFLEIAKSEEKKNIFI